MDEHRRALEERRRVLQADAARQARLETIRDATDILDAAGVAYDVVLDAPEYPRWIVERFPVRGTGGVLDRGRIEVEAPPDALDDAPAGWLAGLGRRLGADRPVVLLRSNGICPVLRLRLGDVLAHPEIVSSYPESWVFDPAGDWIIEYAPEAGWAFARRASGAARQE